MNRNFKDTWYYLKRAGESGRRGVVETLSPVERTVRDVLGRDQEPRPTRSERLKAEFDDLKHSTEQDARRALRRSRDRIEEYRDSRIP